MASMVKSASGMFSDFEFKEIAKLWYFGDSLPVAPSMDSATVAKYEREYDKAIPEFKQALIAGTVEDEYLSKVPLSYRKKHNLIKPVDKKTPRKKSPKLDPGKLEPRPRDTQGGGPASLDDFPDQELTDFSTISEDIKPKWTQGLTGWVKSKLSDKNKDHHKNGEAESLDPISFTGKMSDDLKDQDKEREVKKQSPFDKFKQSFFKGVLEILKQIDKNTKQKKGEQTKHGLPNVSLFDVEQNGKVKHRRKKQIDPFENAFNASTSGKIFNATMQNVSPGLAFAMQLTKHQILERKKKQLTLKYKKRKEEAAKRSTQPSVDEPIQAAKFNTFDGDKQKEPIQETIVPNVEEKQPEPSGFNISDLLNKRPPITPPAAGGVGALNKIKNFAGGALRFLGGGSVAAGAGVLAAGAVAADSLTDAYHSATTGESNKYSDVANSAARKLFGWEENETIGSKLFDTFNKSDVQDTKKLNSDNLDKVQAKTKADVLATQEDKTAKKTKEQNMINTSVNSPSSTTNVMSPNTPQGGGKGIGTRNVESSFKRYLDSRTNFA